MSSSVLPYLKIPELPTLTVGQDAICFAALADKVSKKSKYNTQYWICAFKDCYDTKDFFIFSDNRAFPSVAGWNIGEPFRLLVRSKSSQRGVELNLIEARPVDPELDAEEGFDLSELFEVSRFDQDECFQAVLKVAADNIPDPFILELVRKILAEHETLLKQMPAAAKMHHAFTGGLIEHIRSVARVAVWLGRHYAHYYNDLDPPLNLSVITAAAILHDIGKLVELSYSPVVARYTTLGQLIGHILIGRDIIRDTAASIPGFPAETLMQLEHAVLAHHGKREFGSPVLPQTMEAYLVSMVDELDAKMNQIACARLKNRTGDDFTEDLNFSEGRRRFYRGIPVNPPSADGEANGSAPS